MNSIILSASLISSDTFYFPAFKLILASETYLSVKSHKSNCPLILDDFKIEGKDFTGKGHGGIEE